jgi:cephalosporin hydroxylase
MKVNVDTGEGTLELLGDDGADKIPLYSTKAFQILSAIWLKVGWNEKYSYTFSWLGRPIIQLPEDMVRIQEAIWLVKPDVIVETGIAHGGSLIYYASLLTVLGSGRVIGVDIQIRPHARNAIEEHPLANRITMLEGSSTSQAVLDSLRLLIKPSDKVMVILDSSHTREHVLRELDSLSPLVSEESYIVATDGVMKDLFDTPMGKREWKENNPCAAVSDFVAQHPEFVVEQPRRIFDESQLDENITYWPGAYLRRLKQV